MWGAATAAYQIEGSAFADGRGPSTWDEFCRRPGTILKNHTGDIACDHYRRYKTDVALMQTMGLKAYRFSIAWPRIFPDGEGRPNPRGVDFYKRLCEELINAGITPFATLFHWDLPLALEEKYGGWRSKETARRFADYAHYMAEMLQGHVAHFITINETFCFTVLAHREDFNAMHAPGKIETRRTVNQIIHNALLGHGLALAAIRSARPDAQVGFAETGEYFMPAYDHPAHIEAARRAFERENRQILLPHFQTGYHPEFLAREGADAPEHTDEEMALISAPMDFIGLNYYKSQMVRHADNADGYEVVPVPESMPRTHMGWEITPRGLYHLLKQVSGLCGDTPIYITENGMSADDRTNAHGEILDVDRLEYYRQHLAAVAAAIDEGVNVQGYFAWSLMDNFEWSKGYTQRFGLVRVDYATQLRTLKLSGQYYSDVIRAGRVL